MLTIKLAPVVLAILYALAMWRFSIWRIRTELDSRSRPLDEPGLRVVLDRLARALGLPDVPVHVYQADMVNGLAAPDGRIFLTEGFLQQFRRGEVTDEELAGVIAHELGHVALGHVRRRAIDFSGANAVQVVLAGVLGRFIPVVGFWIAQMLTTMLVARLSRQDEYEADAWASALLIKAGIGTAPQKSLFERLGRLTGAGGARGPAWLMSHPATADRIAAIEANERRWGLA
jgi:putative metalloprotease